MIVNIEVGKCYAAKSKNNTGNDQHRRVLCIDNGIVIYESWGSDAQNYRDNQLSRNKASIETFTGSVYKEIDCPTGIKLLSDVQAELKKGCSEK